MDGKKKHCINSFCKAWLSQKANGNSPDNYTTIVKPYQQPLGSFNGRSKRFDILV